MSLANRKAYIYASRRGILLRKQWRARIVSTVNANVILVTPEGYNNVVECEQAVLSCCPTITIEILD